jgi:hypothetical protein
VWLDTPNGQSNATAQEGQLCLAAWSTLSHEEAAIVLTGNQHKAQPDTGVSFPLETSSSAQHFSFQTLLSRACVHKLPLSCHLILTMLSTCG